MANARTNGAPPVGVEQRRPGRMDALRIRDFRFLFIGTVSSGFGQWAQMIGLNWLAYEISGQSATQLALVASAGGGAPPRRAPPPWSRPPAGRRGCSPARPSA